MKNINFPVSNAVMDAPYRGRATNKTGKSVLMRSAVSCGILLLVSGGAFAQMQSQSQILGETVAGEEPKTLLIQASQAFQRDNNIFRLSEQSNTQALLGTTDRSDTVSTTTGGLRFNKAYSLQRFEAGFNVERYNYSRFSNLNFTAVNYAAAWRWSITPAFRGNLTTDRREFVDNLADVQGQGVVNRRTNRTTVLDGGYDIDGVWRVLGGVFKRDSKNSVRTFEGDSTVSGAEVGVRYQLPYATALEYRYRNGSGEYENRFFGGLGGADFKDREHELRGEWRPGGRTTLQAKIAYLDRKHDTLPARDFSGVTGQLDWGYEFTGKTSAVAGIVRELGSYQTNNASYYQGTRVFIAPMWRATDKITLKARYDYGMRDFKGPLAGFVDTGRSDKIHLASVSAEYQALRALKLTTWAQQDKRTSNEAFADYKSTSVGVSALVSF